MIATDRPRFYICAACVAARGLESGDKPFARIATDITTKGKCDDCGVNFAELEAWRPLRVPPPVATLPMLSHLDLTEDRTDEQLIADGDVELAVAVSNSRIGIKARTGMKPSVGRIVHYTNLGDKDGRFPPEVQAALITKVTTRPTIPPDLVNDEDAAIVSLHIFYPTGQFDMVDVPYTQEEAGSAAARGKWTWPARV
jgi:hypothetical protein